MKQGGTNHGRSGWLIAVAALATLSGCAASTGDGNVVDDWAAMAQAKPKVPVAGLCFESAADVAASINPVLSEPVPCTRPHAGETFHVGQFPDEVKVLPVAGTADYWRAFDECETQARAFLGGEWYNGRLYLTLAVPFTRQWEGGGRWYRCELIETKTVSEVVATRTASLRNALKGDAPVAQRCFTVTGMTKDGWEDLAPIDCAQPHDAEYAGSLKAAGIEVPTDAQRDRIFDGCQDVVARYLGGTKERIRLGYLSWSASGNGWKRGDRWVRCYAWRDDAKLTGSVKGLGNAAPRG